MRLKHLLAHLRFYDRISLGYLWLTLFLAAFSSKPIPIRGRIIASHFFLSLVIVGLIYFVPVRSQAARYRRVCKWLTPVRDLYPFFLFTFVLFGEFTYLANLVFPYWIEHYLITFDRWLFKQPAHQFIVTHTSAWMVEAMAFAYWSYYPIIAYAALRFYLKRGTARISRRQQVNPGFLDFMNRICLSFYACYVLFMLLPARSPRHALELNGQLQLAGGFFFDLISQTQNYVSVVGAAFPSSHVAVAWIAVAALRQSDRYIFFILVPLVVALSFSVFILQYHYVLDAVAGVVVAGLLEWFWRMQNAPGRIIDKQNPKSRPALAISRDSSAVVGLRK